LQRLQSVEKDLEALKSSTAAKEDVGKVRAEMKKVYVSFRPGIAPGAWLQSGARAEGLDGQLARRSVVVV
jgi:hypothetical protein